MQLKINLKKKKKMQPHVNNDVTAIFGRSRLSEQINGQGYLIRAVARHHAGRTSMILGVHRTHETLVEAHANIHRAGLAHRRNGRLKIRVQ